jgi:hypothetical protein
VILALALAGAACSKKAEPLSASSSAPATSPTITMSAFLEAIKNKDIEAFKKTLSRSSLEMLENAAKRQNTTLDEGIKVGLNSPNAAASVPSGLPEVRNEKIDGNTATLEVKNDRTNVWESIPFVKEDNEWKIALDKAMREAQLETFK